MANNDDIYDVQVGDHLTQEQIYRAAGGGKPTDAPEEELIADKKYEDDQDILSDDVLEKQYRYPIDLNKSRASYISFEAQYIEGLDVTKPIFDGLRWLGSQATVENKQTSTAQNTDETPEQKKTREEEEQQAQESATDQLIQEAVSGEARSTYEVPVGTPVGGVSLYLPQSISFNDGVNYNTAELGIIGGVTESLLGGSTGGTGGIVGADGNLNSGFGRMVTRLGTQAGITSIGTLVGGLSSGAKNRLLSSAAGTVAGAIGARAVGDALGAVTRVTTNPNVRSLFKNVTMRQFKFSFRLVAQSHDEAEEIKGIIKFFRNQVYPETIRLGGVPFGYIFPNIFTIKMYNGNTEIENRILPSYLENVSVTYNPSGAGLHSDGNWTDVDIQLGFVECTTLDKQRIKEGY